MENNLFSKKECLDIINKSEQENNWTDLYSNIYHYKISKYPLSDSDKNKIYQYCKNHLNIELIEFDASVMKYETGDYIKKHVDRFVDIESHNKYHTNMLYNVNMILNDDYEGGLFLLKGNPYIQDIGTVYHYRSDEFHEVTPITSGIRYSMLFYIKESYIKRKIGLI